MPQPRRRSAASPKADRFTGRPPTPEALQRYPNWMLALDEEGEPGQDESTVRPDDDQESISMSTMHTAAVAVLPDGTERPAMLSGDDLSDAPWSAERLTIFTDDGTVEVEIIARWWWPVTNAPTLPYHDYPRFPIRVRTVLPSGQTGEPHRLALLPDGELLFGDEADAATVDAPVVIHVGAPEVKPDHARMLGRWRGSEYDLSGGKRRQVGTSEGELVRVPGTGMLESSSVYQKKDKKSKTDVVDRTTLDARTLELFATTGSHDGVPFDLSRTADGESRIPPGVFGDAYLVLQSMDLAAGMRFIVPVYVSFGRTMRRWRFEVQGRQPAPDGAGTDCWLVHSHIGGPFYTRVWVDARTRQVVATQLHTLVGEKREGSLTLYEHER